MKNLCLLFLLTTINNINIAQNIPFGYSLDSAFIREVNTPYFETGSQLFYIYKPITYNSQTSKMAIIIHGSGGNGLDAISDFEEIAERRGVLMIGLQMEGYGCVFKKL